MDREKSKLGSEKLARGLYDQQLRISKNILASLFFALCLLSTLCLIYANREGEGFGDLTSSIYLAISLLFGERVVEETTGPLMLELVRVIAPLFTLVIGMYAFLPPMRAKISLLLLKYIDKDSDVILIIGIGGKGIEVLKGELLSDGMKNDHDKNGEFSERYLILEKDHLSPNLPIATGLGATVWVGDAENLSDLATVLVRAPKTIWIMTGDADINVRILSKIRSLVKDVQNDSLLDGTCIKVHVPTFCSVRLAQNLAILNPANVFVGGPKARPSYEVTLFNQEEIFAQWLAKRSFIHDDAVAETNPRFLIVGMGGIGCALLRELLMLAHYPDRCLSEGPEFVLIDGSEFIENSIVDEVPIVRTTLVAGNLWKAEPESISSGSIFKVWLHKVDATKVTFEDYASKIRGLKQFTHVYVCLGSELLNLSVAQKISAWESLIGSIQSPELPKTNAKLFPVVYSDYPKNWAFGIDGQDVDPVEIFQIYKSESLRWFEHLRTMATRIDLLYRTNRDELSVDLPGWEKKLEVCSDESLWFQKIKYDQRTNLACARYIYSRFQSRGRDSARTQLVPDKGDCKWKPFLAHSEEELEQWASSEHRRWMTFVRMDGVTSVAMGQALDPDGNQAVGLRNLGDKEIPAIHEFDLYGQSQVVSKIRRDNLIRKLAFVNKNLEDFEILSTAEKGKDKRIVENIELICFGIKPQV
ncbi:MAG: hypothetical protein EB069_04805 [Actinobacteria bacterium]|nr:hypothetical protein [Actinomycetota bacterium]